MRSQMLAFIQWQPQGTDEPENIAMRESIRAIGTA